MFKSVFRKYLVAFILILSMSFLLLSGIIAVMIRSYSMQEKEKQNGCYNTEDGKNKAENSKALDRNVHIENLTFLIFPHSNIIL